MAQQQIISEQDKAQLKRTFRKDLKADVNLHLFTQEPSPLTIPGRECPTCPQTRQLMEELAGLSPKLRLETIDFYHEAELVKEFGVARIPAIVLDADGSNRITFYGIPAGYELAALVEDIKTISRGVSPLSMETRKQLRKVNQPVHIQVFVTPSDTDCPGVARLAHAIALECPQVTADVVEVQEFPSLAQNYAVRSVPFTVINEYTKVSGPMSEPQMLQHVLAAGVAAVSKPDPEQIKSEEN
ncbi:MAG: thioredoxin family protein [Chloroflexi bacterium]|nr:thioredoxin family protein [Chloroflexota bacterium]